jgi:hypothetical protein
MQASDRRQGSASAVPKTTGQKVSFGPGVFFLHKGFNGQIPAK